MKFGRHQKWFVELAHPDAYIVPYNDAKSHIEEEEYVAPEEFEAQWRAYLENARKEFDASLQALWRRVFVGIGGLEEGRGAPPEKALLLFSQHSTPSHVHEVLDQFKALHATALLNAEALRKLVKKYDKKQKHSMDESSQSKQLTTKEGESASSMTVKLLPEVYAASFVMSLTALQQGIDLLRSELGLGEHAQPDPTPAAAAEKAEKSTFAQRFPSKKGAKVSPSKPMENGAKGSPSKPMENGSTKPPLPPGNPTNGTPPRHPDSSEKHQNGSPESFRLLSKDDRKDSHAENTRSVDKRREELVWLRQSVEQIDQLGCLHNLVAHRGFHSPQDRSDRRPLENSLSAYEAAWTSGIHLCECDIAFTKDERLILAHDEDFSRLALDSSNEKSSRLVRDLTFQEIMSVALKSGSRPPLLLDVLQSAHAIGGQSQLIIEIKPGNREAASALARLFGQHPYLMAHCAVIMSFDLFVMHALQEEMDAWFGSTFKDEENSGMKHRRCYSLGIFPGSNAKTAMEPSPTPVKQHNRPKLLLLTVCDDPKREVELQVSIEEGDEAQKKIKGWIKELDGVYMQYETSMITDKGIFVMRQLARRMHVGVWGHNGRDPDDCATFGRLVQGRQRILCQHGSAKGVFRNRDFSQQPNNVLSYLYECLYFFEIMSFPL